MLRQISIDCIATVCVLVITGCAAPPSVIHKVAVYRPSESSRDHWRWAPQDNPVSVAGEGQATNPQQDPAGVSRVLKRGDKITITLRGIPDPVEINSEVDGKGVNMPWIGRVILEGKSLAAAADLIQAEYINRQYYKSVNVIIMAQEEEFFVLGEVKKEGRYLMSGDMTLMQALTLAGGYTDFAARNKIKILRGGRALYFNAKKIENMDEKDPPVLPGDQIIVPPRRWW